ncbi:hypothetical protein MAPG_04360 [Magnaporthiopsis poae ATCC 64411]|uniref:Uncharacterized protein n=1 Tax=Magnaporthiopsis poae (strain ATCC 64411 / 73-15) TaxID=644358 RepID=A0A0C4DWI0_MAGP6|nr:hypothetical protein MAPG_04360 [Magnaporthiopsis poae ATCC 64411]
MQFATRLRATALGMVALSGLALSQTWSACNPLHATTCPANTALAMTVNVDFTKGAVDAFRPSGGGAAPSIRSDGKLIPAAGALIRPPHLALIFGPLILGLIVVGIRR